MTERVLQPGRSERGVDEQVRSSRMRFARIRPDIQREAGRVDGRLQMDHVPAMQVRGRTVQREDLGSRRHVVQANHAVRAEVRLPDRDPPRAKEYVGGVKSG